MWHITYSSRVRKVQQQLSAAERRQTSKTEAFVCISLTRSVFQTLMLSGSRALPCNGKTIILKCCCVIQAYLKAKVLTPVSNGRPQQWRRNCASRSRLKWTVQVEITLAGHKSCVCVWCWVTNAIVWRVWKELASVPIRSPQELIFLWLQDARLS